MYDGKRSPPCCRRSRRPEARARDAPGDRIDDQGQSKVTLVSVPVHLSKPLLMRSLPAHGCGPARGRLSRTPAGAISGFASANDRLNHKGRENPSGHVGRSRARSPNDSFLTISLLIALGSNLEQFARPASRTWSLLEYKLVPTFRSKIVVPCSSPFAAAASSKFPCDVVEYSATGAELSAEPAGRRERSSPMVSIMDPSRGSDYACQGAQPRLHAPERVTVNGAASERLNVDAHRRR